MSIVFLVSLALAKAPVSMIDRIWSRCIVEKSEFCDGYMLAVRDQMEFHKEICPPPTALNPYKVTERYVRAHPEASHLGYGKVIADAFRNAFPCSPLSP